MILLHNVGPKINSNYNTLEEILSSEGKLSFDGVYRNVFDSFEAFKERDITLFVMGNYIGKDNSFDVGMPLERLCTMNEIMLMASNGAKIGWHTWSHRDLTKLSDEELEKEVTPIFPMKYFAYPYGKFNDMVIEAVKKAGFEEAWSVTEGDDSQFQRLRRYL